MKAILNKYTSKHKNRHAVDEFADNKVVDANEMGLEELKIDRRRISEEIPKTKHKKPDAYEAHSPIRKAPSISLTKASRSNYGGFMADIGKEELLQAVKSNGGGLE